MDIAKYIERKINPCQIIANSDDYPMIDKEHFEYMEQSYCSDGKDMAKFFIFSRKLPDGTRYFDIYLFDVMLDKGYTRFIVQKDMCMSESKETLFDEYCLCGKSTVDDYYIDEIIEICRVEYPEIHMSRYENPLSIISHLFYAMHRGGARELLYKINLDYLANNIEKIDDYNLIGRNPRELFDGVPVKVLRQINSKFGIELLSNSQSKELLIQIHKRFGDRICKGPMNKYQWEYLVGIFTEDQNFEAKRYRLLGEIEADWVYCDYQLAEKYIEDIKDYFQLPAITKDEEIYPCKECAESIRSYIVYEESINEYLSEKYKYIKKYEYADEEYCIIAPTSLREILQESNRQHNCLWEFVYNIAFGYMIVVFMRKKDCPDKSWITIEICDDGIEKEYISQAFRACNKKPKKEEIKWLKKYARQKGICFLKPEDD